MGTISQPRPLTKTDDRSGFDCGKPVLNHWFQRHAWGNERENASRTYVISDDDAGCIVGYVTLATGQIERQYLAKSAQRNKPDPVPVLLLGQLAIDKRYQGKGLGADLLRHALLLAREIATTVGFVGILTHPLDASAKAFYQRWGFEPLAEDPKGAMILLTRHLNVSPESTPGQGV